MGLPRHLDHYLSSPLPFLSAVGQHTSSISPGSLGTAVLPMRYQEPVLLAEATGVADLLVDGDGQEAPVGTELKVTPHSPGLRDRVRQGVASIGSAEHAADLALPSICGTVLTGLAEGGTFPEHQARVIGAYRTRWAAPWGTEPPPGVVADSVLPGTTADRRERHAAYEHQRRTEGWPPR